MSTVINTKPHLEELKLVITANPAAGTELSHTVPSDVAWLVVGAYIGLTTNATAANRRLSLVFDDGTTNFARLPIGVTQAANLTYTYSFAPGLPRASAVESNVVVSPLPDFMLPSGYRIRTLTENIQSGDDFTAAALYVVEFSLVR